MYRPLSIQFRVQVLRKGLDLLGGSLDLANPVSNWGYGAILQVTEDSRYPC